MKQTFEIKNFLCVLSGTIILSVATSLFIVPYSLVAGGVTGIAVSISHIFPSLGVDALIGIMSWALFFAGYFILGQRFALKTFVSSMLYPLFVSFFSNFSNGDVLGGFFHLPSSMHSEIGIILAAIFGGGLTGAGCALTFLGGGSSGGTDIIAFTVCKFFKRAKSSAVIFCIDFLVICFGMFALSDLALSLLGVVAAFVSAIVIDKIFVGGIKAFMANIISDRAEEISREIIQSLGRTTTIVDAKGGFTGEMRKIIMFTFTMREYSRLMSIAKGIDPDAFIVIHRAHEINGKGWND